MLDIHTYAILLTYYTVVKFLSVDVYLNYLPVSTFNECSNRFTLIKFFT